MTESIYKLYAYAELVQDATDPDVFEEKLWALAPGSAVPEGCIPLYWKCPAPVESLGR